MKRYEGRYEGRGTDRYADRSAARRTDGRSGERRGEARHVRHYDRVRRYDDARMSRRRYHPCEYEVRCW
jgi:hypothetical protein